MLIININALVSTTNQSTLLYKSRATTTS